MATVMTMEQLNTNPRIPKDVREVEEFHVHLWIRAVRGGYYKLASALLCGYVMYNMQEPWAMMGRPYRHYSFCSCGAVHENRQDLQLLTYSCPYCVDRHSVVERTLKMQTVGKYSHKYADPMTFVGQKFQRVFRKQLGYEL